jgi:hypothetical protein
MTVGGVNVYAHTLRGSVSKYVTRGSKTAVMDVIVFLCVSPGSSTIQLHDSLGSNAHVQRLVSAVKIATLFGGVLPKSNVLLFFFSCGQMDSIQKVFIKKCFLFTVGSVCSTKGFTTRSGKFSRGRSKVADDARLDAEVAETTDKRLLCRGFRHTGKAMRQVYQC